MSLILETLVKTTHPNHNATVIWMHGLGADGHDFEDIVPQLGLPDHLKLKFIFPHAPFRAITLNRGMNMRAWYDITAIDPQAPEDRTGLEQSRQAIELLIEQEMQQGIPSKNIILAGFSQGGAMALYTGLRYKERLAGVIALSGYLPMALTLGQEKSPLNQKTPIFMAHGLYDMVVPVALAQFSYHALQQQQYQTAWRTYPMQHQVCQEELEDISQWLQKVLMD